MKEHTDGVTRGLGWILFIAGVLGIWVFLFGGWFAARLLTINLALAIFNMLPVPPLDGSKLLLAAREAAEALGLELDRPAQSRNGTCAIAGSLWVASTPSLTMTAVMLAAVGM